MMAMPSNGEFLFSSWRAGMPTKTRIKPISLIKKNLSLAQYLISNEFYLWCIRGALPSVKPLLHHLRGCPQLEVGDRGLCKTAVSGFPSSQWWPVAIVDLQKVEGMISYRLQEPKWDLPQPCKPHHYALARIVSQKVYRPKAPRMV